MSVASIREAEVKARFGTLDIADGELHDDVRPSGFDLVGTTPDDAVSAGRLPPHHGDPFDRNA